MADGSDGPDCTQDLLLRWRDGDRGALDTLLVRDLPWIRGRIGRRLGDHLRGNVRIQFSAGEVVQEKQGLGALNQHIIDAHGDQVDADRVMSSQLLCDHQLGADAVGSGNQHGFSIASRWQCEHSAETAQARQHFRTLCSFYEWLDALDEFGASVDVDACIFVGKRFIGH